MPTLPKAVTVGLIDQDFLERLVGCAEIFPLEPRFDADLYIIDSTHDVLSAVDLCRRVMSVYPQAKVLIIALDKRCAAKNFNQLTSAGARGFILKDGSKDVLDQAIRDLLNGLKFCDPGIDSLSDSKRVRFLGQ
jgi:DNA-binding NarL/FixJ family response regulator